MLYPRDSESRDVKELNGIWRFKLDVASQGRGNKWFAAPLDETIPMAVPASYNDQTQDIRIRDHVGDVWYERDFFVPAEWLGKRVVLRFGAVCHKAVVWVNGREVMSNKGAYLPFETDVSDAVKYGASNRVTVVVDNILDWTTLPPGTIKEEKTIACGKIQEYQHDFFNYAGIHRPVRLYCTPRAYISDVTVVTDIRRTDGIVRYAVEMTGGKREVKVSLADETGKTVASATGAESELTIKKARLWEPGNAYLCTLCVETVSKGKAEDIYRLPVGIRTIKIEGAKFLINGKPFYFKGFGKHEDMDIKGKGLDETMIVKDFNLLRWMGANSFRTSHYPYSEELMNLAAREGFVIIDESSAVGLYMFKGKQDVFTQDRVNILLEHHLQVMRELVARDKNHPCVVMWSVANESASQEKSFEEYFRQVFAITRELDPQKRPVTMAFHTWFDNDCATKFADVICLNRYWSWYGDTGNLEVIEPKASREIAKWFEHHPKPLMLTEYGADTIAGMHSDPPVVFTEEYQCEMIRRVNNVLDRLDLVIGEHLWNFADFMTKQGITRIIGNRKGILTRQRQPKMIAHMLKRRWTGTGWTDRPTPGAC